MRMQEKGERKFDVLIELFEKNLAVEFKENWERGKLFSI